jgi:hypothetical protein
MHDNINTKVENLISQSKWGIVIYSYKPKEQGCETFPWQNDGFYV